MYLQMLNRPPPTIASAIFADSGEEVTVAFDIPTDMASYAAGDLFVCDNVVDFPGAENSACRFTDLLTLVAGVSSATVVPGDVLAVQPNVLKRFCELGIRCECDVFANRTSAFISTVDAPVMPVVPVAELIYSSTASTCEPLEVDASLSSGSGGRAMLFEWTLEVNGSVVLTNASAGAQDLLRISSPELESLVNATNETEVDLVITLKLENFLNQSSTSEPILISVGSNPVPSVRMNSGREVDVTPTDGVDVSWNAVSTSCDDRSVADRATDLEATLVPVSLDGRRLDDAVNYTSASADPRRFLLAPYTLEVGDYELTVITTDRVLGFSSSETTSIRVVRSPLEAVIAGGDRRIAARSIVELSAAASRDPDVASGATGAAAGLTFEWSSEPAQLLAGRTAESLTIDIEDAGLYVIRVAVFAADGRNSTTEVEYDVVAFDVDPPEVSVTAPTWNGRISNGVRVVFRGQADTPADEPVYDNATLVTTWSVFPPTLADGAALANAATTLISLAAVGSRRHDLVLPVGTLPIGVSYVFTLNAGLATSDMTTYARVTVTTAAPPTSGVVIASPPTGMALQTPFELRTTLWVTDDPPLRYSFESRVLLPDGGSQTSILIRPTDGNVLRDARLPAGNPNVTVIAHAIDALGGIGNAFVQVLVETPTYTSSDGLFRDVKEQLNVAVAYAQSEGVAQTIVTAASIQTLDANLTNFMLNELAATVAGQDDQAPLIEQASVALDAASGPDGLDNTAATTALDTARSLATGSLVEGITPAAADALVSTVSTVLNTSLFAASNTNETQKGNASRAIGDALDGVCRGQLVWTVEDEKPQTLEEANVRTSAARFSSEAFDGAPRVLGVSSGAAARLPDDLGASYESWFVEFDTNTHENEPGGDEAESTTMLRFGLANYDNTESASAPVQVAFDFSSVSSASIVNPGAELAANLTCECGNTSTVRHFCPDGTVLSYQCEGVDAVFESRCPRVDQGCLSWDVVARSWTGDNCELVPSETDALRCQCDIVPAGASLDVSSNTDVVAALSAYSSSLQAKPDLGQAVYILRTLATMVVICGMMAIYAKRLDCKDRADLAKGLTPGSSEAESRRPSDSSAEEVKDDDDLHDGAAFRNHIDALPRHERFLTGARTRRYIDAFKRTHPFVQWLFVYNPKISRTLRVWTNVFFETLLFMFLLAVENNLFYPDPGCEDQSTYEDCLDFPKAAKWMPGGGHDMCEWDQCSQECTPYLPDETEGTKPAHLLAISLVVFLTLPCLKLFEWIHVDKMARPVPHVLQCCSSNDRTGAPSNPEDAESKDGEISGDQTSAAEHDEAAPPDEDLEEMESEKVKTSSSSRRKTLSTRLFATSSRARKNKENMERALESADEAEMQASAKAAAPEVADIVEAQSAELTVLIDELQARSDPEAKTARRLLRKLLAHIQQTWGYSSTDRAAFEANVCRRLQREMKTSLDWHRQLVEMRKTCGDDDDRYRRKGQALLIEFDQVKRMSSPERRLFYSTLHLIEEKQTQHQQYERREPPPLVVYVGAWLMSFGSAAFFVWYLIQTASLIGKRRSWLWLTDVFFTFVVVYVMITPAAIFFFQIWTPDLLHARLEKDNPKTTKPFPFSRQTPSALTFLLARHPEFDSSDQREIGKATPLLYNTDDVVANVPDYVNAEMWRPPPDSRFLIVLLAQFALLGDDIQTVLFEEAIIFTPYAGAVIVDYFQTRGFILFLTLAIGIFLLFVAYVLLEGTRMIVRHAYKRFSRSSTVAVLAW